MLNTQVQLDRIVRGVVDDDDDDGGEEDQLRRLIRSAPSIPFSTMFCVKERI